VQDVRSKITRFQKKKKREYYFQDFHKLTCPHRAQKTLVSSFLDVPMSSRFQRVVGVFEEILDSSLELLITAMLKEGDTVPEVVFKARVRYEALGGPNPFEWKDVTTSDLFKGKRVVLFALPGAFTPTCSSTHVPGYERNYEAIKAAGIDEIYCLSVNDAFVMRQWGIHLVWD